MIIEERWSIIKGDFSFFFSENKHKLENHAPVFSFTLILLPHFTSCLTLDVWVFHTAGISATPAGCPTVQLSSDAIYLEVASRPSS